MTEFTSARGLTLKPLTKIDYADCPIGNAITDSMLHGEWIGEADIAFINNGGIRSEFREGEITGDGFGSFADWTNMHRAVFILEG